ncbi:WD repeat, SAM and U-box domain-containing protein 1-like [Anneissia japonica]|uniref:WD repeat, SAM and U-box domain-containing protein 1-like n=1 Tax=Anneissia japonica TaxID=1529436 RepID=UPI0014257CD8|nr:WD repeat, SAM and U-box domain-containing protein 1-like [Anneissia japonica]XP_033105845.1 WD repeat, SAM and U-box domain-containing protein 1-like [Anneissia japonica]XP_033105846.1 WD repeat, SAM and U-box domain-containing protein 1-like [Anneissia japonica]
MSRSSMLAAVLKTHTSDVNSVAFSGSLLATCSGDKTVRLYKISENFKELAFSPLVGHSYYVHCCVFSPFGTTLASCSTDGKIILWDTRTGQTLSTFKHESNAILRVCRFSPDSKYLVSGAADNILCVWDVKAGKLIKSLEGHVNVVTACAFTPDSEFIVSCSANGDLRIWNASGRSSMCLFYDPDCHDLAAGCLAISPTFGSAHPDFDFSKSGMCYFLLATCGDNLVKLWDLETSPACCTKLRCELKGHTANVTSVAFSADGLLLASGAFDKTVIIWNPLTSEKIQILEGHSRYVTSVAFSPDGNYLASGSNDKTAQIWNITENQGFHEFVSPDDITIGQEDLVVLPSNFQAKNARGDVNVDALNFNSKALKDWSVQDVVDWLELLGLSQYCAAFSENHIDGQELQVLDSDTLANELGVKPLGHKSKILRGLKAIQEQTFFIGKDQGGSIPDEYLCPITREVMKDPVICADGFTYERTSIESWLRKNNSSPMTNSPLVNCHLTPNRSLKTIIQRMYNP